MAKVIFNEDMTVKTESLICAGCGKPIEPGKEVWVEENDETNEEILHRMEKRKQKIDELDKQYHTEGKIKGFNQHMQLLLDQHMQLVEEQFKDNDALEDRLIFS